MSDRLVIRWLTQPALLAMHGALIAEHGGAPGVRDAGLLDSALQRPRHRHQYAPNSSLCRLAAAYAYGIARNHPFFDGNKRLALTACAVFLQLHGQRLAAPEPETAVTFTALAAGELTAEALADWLCRHCEPA